jgi:hypothetical protein
MEYCVNHRDDGHHHSSQGIFKPGEQCRYTDGYAFFRNGLFCREWRRYRGLKYSFEIEKSSILQKMKLTDQVVINIALIIALAQLV